MVKTMKKMMIIEAAIVATAITATATFAATYIWHDQHRPISLNELPATAKSFVDKHFGSKEVSFVTAERETFGAEYNVAFVDGTKIEFNSKGEWTNIECKGSAVPSGAVPSKIADYIKRNHTNTNIVEINREPREWEVKLSNGLELTFDSKFRVIDIDD